MDGTRFRFPGMDASGKERPGREETRTPSDGQSVLRPGPRPLPMYLANAAMTWSSCGGVLPFLKSGWQTWRPEKNPDLARRAEGLRADIGRLESDNPPGRSENPAENPDSRDDTHRSLTDRLSAEIEREGRRRLDGFLRGVDAYRNHPARREVEDPATVWKSGNSRLLDYGSIDDAPPGADQAPPLLFVPSLVNRAYILDLEEKNSLMRWLVHQGFRPFLLDWGVPGEDERGFTLTDYIAGRLDQVLDAVLTLTGRSPVMAGYCMGGNLALALATRRPQDLAGLVLLATPWDFHSEGEAWARAGANVFLMVQPEIERLGVMPVDMLQAMFNGINPGQTITKFRKFADLDQNKRKARSFVILEDWVNDGVPLAASVARECILDWQGRNTTARGKWRVAGEPVRPARLRAAAGPSGAALPVLVALPNQDRIVPPRSAAALAREMPWADVLNLRAGHISMVASRKAPELLWEKLAAWLRGPGAARG